jgi:hypothetical protein
MTRKKTEIEFSTDCKEAYQRLLSFAERLSAMLTGDLASPETGVPYTARANALTMSMMLFLLRADPGDIHALLFAEGSLAQCKRSNPAEFKMDPIFADALR